MKTKILKKVLLIISLFIAFNSYSQWSSTSTTLPIYRSGSVAIGSTSNPIYNLQVVAPANAWKARFSGTDGYYIDIGPANYAYAHIYTDRPSFLFNKPVWSMDGKFSSFTGSDMFLQTSGTTRLTINNLSGNVGIGNSNNSYKLDVTGDINYTGNLYQNGQLLNLGGQWSSVANGISYTSGNVGIGTNTIDANKKLKIEQSVSNSGDLSGIEINVNNTSTSAQDVTGIRINADNYGDDSDNAGLFGIYSQINTHGGHKYDCAAGLFYATGIDGTGIWVYSQDDIGATISGGMYGVYASGVYAGVKATTGSGNALYAVRNSTGMGSYFNKAKAAIVIDDDNLMLFDGNEIYTDGELHIGSKSGIINFFKLDENGVIDDVVRVDVDGILWAEEIEVKSEVDADYVFEENYKLLPLNEVEDFIKTKKHLPEIPSAKEFSETGQNLAAMDNMLLKKIEELTLYVIELKKENEEMKREMEKIKNQ